MDLGAALRAPSLDQRSGPNAWQASPAIARYPAGGALKRIWLSNSTHWEGFIVGNVQSIYSLISSGRTLPFQIARMFDHHRHPSLPTDFD